MSSLESAEGTNSLLMKRPVGISTSRFVAGMKTLTIGAMVHKERPKVLLFMAGDIYSAVTRHRFNLVGFSQVNELHMVFFWPPMSLRYSRVGWM